MSDRRTNTTQDASDSGVSRRGYLAAIGAGTATGLAGCSGIFGGGGGGKVKIGGMYLLSGLASALGNASAAAARAGVQKVNDEGGINGNDVEIVIRDHGDDPAAQLRSLVQEEEVDALIGLTSSGVTLSNAEAINQLGVPMTLTDIGTPYITEYDTDTYPDKAAFKKNIFRTNASTSPNLYGMAQDANENHSGSRVANIGPGYAYGEQVWEYFKAYSDGIGAGHEYVASEFPSLGATDMTPQINAILDADPDIVVSGFWAGDAVTFFTQAQEQGLFDAVDQVYVSLAMGPDVFAAVGNDMPEGVKIGGWYWHSAFDNEENDEFLDIYAEQDLGSLPSIPSFTGGSAYSAIRMYKKAMEAAGGTATEDVVAELEGIEMTGPRGSWTIDPDSHQATAPAVLGVTSSDDDVPYDGLGLSDTKLANPTREEAADLLEGSGFPPGL
ncbi:ABC transporter substrate-binding protein [Halobacteriales archaeon Cl-PHB]